MRPRLTVSTGYGGAELVGHDGADVIGSTITRSGLRDRDITVRTLHRGTSLIPNLRASFEAGQPEMVRSVTPERSRRRARIGQLPDRPIPS